jgi:2-methylisocitrate lyase-like PEP mutase family enzyme
MAFAATAKFRKMLSEPGIIVAPGAYDCLTATIIQQTGFPSVYMTGLALQWPAWDTRIWPLPL